MKTTLQTLVIMAGMAASIYGLMEVGSRYPKQFAISIGCLCGVITSVMLFVAIKAILDELERERKKRKELPSVTGSSVPPVS